MWPPNCPRSPDLPYPLLAPNQRIPEHRLVSVFGDSLRGALNRNRTDDLILTMDALYRLSYKGLPVAAKQEVNGAGEGNRTLAVSLGS